MTADPRKTYLAAYRRSVESQADVRDANLKAVLDRAGHVDVPEAAPTRWAASALVIKLTTVALVTTGLGWGAIAAFSTDAPPPAPTALASAEDTEPVAATLPAPRSRPARTAPTPAEPAVQHPSPPAGPSAATVRTAEPSSPPEPQTTADRLREELALLEDAQKHLRAGKVKQATQALREHARLFPQGTLSVERAAWSAIAACSGSGPQPKAAARSFTLTHGDTPLVAKVKVECGL